MWSLASGDSAKGVESKAVLGNIKRAIVPIRYVFWELQALHSRSGRIERPYVRLRGDTARPVAELSNHHRALTLTERARRPAVVSLAPT